MSQPRTGRALVALLALVPVGATRSPAADRELPVHAVRAPAADASAAAAALRQRAAELVTALDEYRASLESVLVLREAALAKARARCDASRGYYERGLIARRDVEQMEQAVAAEQRRVDETRESIEQTEHASAEAKATEALALLPPPAPGVEQQTAALLRYPGAGGWSLRLDTPKLEQMFAARFGHALPISAYGQTPVHDRMGFDHHDALDIAVYPDSVEGRALLDYLRAAGIPFMAWRGAVPGAATGAHIHVGQPSPRIVTRR